MSANPVPWLERTFEADPSADRGELLRQLRAAPDRLVTLVAGLSREQLVRRPGEAWSIQEHAGHLLDLEDLHLARLVDLARGAKELRPADLSNRRTYEAHHNDDEIGSILADFRFTREVLAERFEAVDPALRSVHPRLGTPMGAVDLLRFVVEHDEHHLQVAARLAERWIEGDPDGD
jgi:uncharacterized damage-inducible protein DinB